MADLEFGVRGDYPLRARKGRNMPDLRSRMTRRRCRFAFAVCFLAPLAMSAVCRAAAVSELPAMATLEPTLELRQVGDQLVPFQSNIPLPTYEPQNRPKLDLSEGWRMWRVGMDHTLSLTARTPATIRALEQEGRGAHAPEFDHRRWQSVRLPAVANPPPAERPSGVWYRKQVGIPPLWQGRRLLLHCLAANYVADVWVNGRHVGYHEGGFTPFSFDITDHVAWGSDNSIAIRVDNPPWLSNESTGLSGRDLVPYATCDWWNATGILRDLYLEAVPATSLVRVDVRTTQGAEETRLKVTAVVRNAGDEPFAGELSVTIFPAHVRQANLTAAQAEGILTVRKPVPIVHGKSSARLTPAGNTVVAPRLSLITPALRLWSPEEPNLYVLEAKLQDDEGATVDRLLIQFGARTLSVAPGAPQLLLNGQPRRLVGVARVEDYPQFGRVVTFRDALRVLLDLRLAKWAHCDFVRLGHSVSHPLTTMLADRLGLLCWQEIPVARFDAEGLASQWERRRIARQMFLEMLYQDYNRPSVGFWGICHDSGYGEAHVRFVRDLVDMARYLDGTRLIGQSAGMENAISAQAECDVAGLALTGSAGAGTVPEVLALSVLDRLGQALPGKPVIITEFSAAGGTGFVAQDLQAMAARRQVRAFFSRPFVAGCAWWSLADYLGPHGTESAGLVSRDRRTPRPVIDALREEYRTLPEVAADASPSEE